MYHCIRTQVKQTGILVYMDRKDIMEQSELLEQVGSKLAQRLIEEQLARIELEVKYERVLQELEEARLQRDNAQMQLDLQNSHPDATVTKVNPEDLNLPPIVNS